MTYLHNHALFKTAPGWELHRSLHLGLQGFAGSEYVLIRLSDNRRFDRDSQKAIKAILEHKGVAVEWTASPEWNEIKNG